MNNREEIVCTGAEMILKALEIEGVEVIFGYPGGQVLPLYDALYKNKNIEHILTRHEQGAGHAADGYARVTGKPGVAFATSGPGATNMVTALANAQMDSIPMVVITGQVPRALLGKQSFQEANIVEIVKPVTKFSTVVKNLEELPTVIRKAFKIANAGRKGPVLIDVPKDITTEVGEFIYPNHVDFHQDKLGESDKKYSEVINLLQVAKKPLIFLGGGAKDCQKEVEKLMGKINSPLIYSLMGKGIVSDDNPMNLGMIGMHGTGAANFAAHHCDLILGIGVRFDDRATGNLDVFLKGAKVIHFDIDKKEFGKNVHVDIKIHDDAFRSLKVLNSKLLNINLEAPKGWLLKIEDWKDRHKLEFVASGYIKPQEVMEAINRATEGKAYITTEVGQHQMWAAQYIKVDSQNKFITSGGLGTMGFGLPSAIGVQMVDREELVVAIAGDGSIQMNIQELMTITANDLPIKIIIINNSSLGMVRQWQKLFFDERYSHTLFAEKDQPDFVKLAEAFGMNGVRISKREDLDLVISAAIKSKGSILVEVIVDRDENVYPMVPAGAGNNKMLFNE